MPRFIVEDAWVLRVTTTEPPLLDVTTRLTGHRRVLDGTPWIGGAPGEFDGPALACAGVGRRLLVFDPDVEVPVEVALPRLRSTARRWMRHVEHAHDR